MVSTAYDIVNTLFGTNTRDVENPENVDADIASKLMLRNDARRVAFIVLNLSTATVHIRPKADASSTAGIPIAPGGGIGFNVKEDFGLPMLEWHLNATADNSAVFILVTEIAPER